MVRRRFETKIGPTTVIAVRSPRASGTLRARLGLLSGAPSIVGDEKDGRRLCRPALEVRLDCDPHERGVLFAVEDTAKRREPSHYAGDVVSVGP
jgi:hypothetical protein